MLSVEENVNIEEKNTVDNKAEETEEQSKCKNLRRNSIVSYNTNIKCKTKPNINKTLTEIELPKTEEDFLNIYKKPKILKFSSTNLETIYEEPKVAKTELKIYGATKLKRKLECINGDIISKIRKRKRQNRIKTMIGKKKKIIKITMEQFKKHLDSNELKNTDVEAPTTNSKH